MTSFEENLLVALNRAHSEDVAFQALLSAAQGLGFDHVAYGLRLPGEISSARVLTLNSYSERWQRRYEDANYLHVDPSVRQGRLTRKPFVWTDHMFLHAREFWEEAHAHDLRFGWAQSSLDGIGIGGMLTLCRGHGPITEAELSEKETKMRWLVQAAHLSLSRLMQERHGADMPQDLTAREIEVLKWTADGKTSGEISDILNITARTVDFHITNAVRKLKVANKTAAVVQALMRGLLH